MTSGTTSSRRPCNRNRAVLERLAQRLKDGGRELRELVEEERAAVREAFEMSPERPLPMRVVDVPLENDEASAERDASNAAAVLKCDRPSAIDRHRRAFPHETAPFVIR